MVLRWVAAGMGEARKHLAEQEIEQSQGHPPIIVAWWRLWRTCSSAPTTEFLAPTGSSLPAHPRPAVTFRNGDGRGRAAARRRGWADSDSRQHRADHRELRIRLSPLRHLRAGWSNPVVAAAHGHGRSAAAAQLPKSSPHGPVCPVDPRSSHLAPQHRDLVAQHEQLNILCPRTPRRQPKPAHQPAEQHIQQSQGQAPIIVAREPDGYPDQVGCRLQRDRGRPARSVGGGSGASRGVAAAGGLLAAGGEVIKRIKRAKLFV
jgi:hypothetical protein